VDMKHILLISLALLAGGATVSAESPSRWDLFQAMDWRDRAGYLERTPSPGWDEEFLTKALDLDDSSQIETGDDTTVAYKKAIAVRLVQLLAALPAPKAAPAVARLSLQYKDPVVKGEAWVASGRLGDKAVVPSLVAALASLNDSSSRTRDEEVEAAYAVQALGLLKAPESFRAVVAASFGWYSPASGVRASAKKILPSLVPDLPKATLDLLANDSDWTLNEEVFQRVVDEGTPDFQAEAAAAVLGPLVRYQPRDKQDQDRAFRLTLAALVAAQKAPHPPVSLVPSLKVILTRGDNLEAMTHGVRLLGKIDDPSAVDLLSATLTKFNVRQRGGANTTDDLKFVKELFLALGQTGKAAARPALEGAKASDYSPAMVQDATSALAKLPQ